jgi:hypothetical protein
MLVHMAEAAGLVAGSMGADLEGSTAAVFMGAGFTPAVSHGGGFRGDGFHDRGFGRFRGGFGVLGWPYYAYPYGSDYYPDYG